MRRHIAQTHVKILHGRHRLQCRTFMRIAIGTPVDQQAKRQDYRRTWTRRLGKPEPTDAERLAWWEQSYGLAQGTLAK